MTRTCLRMPQKNLTWKTEVDPLGPLVCWMRVRGIRRTSTVASAAASRRAAAAAAAAALAASSRPRSSARLCSSATAARRSSVATPAASRAARSDSAEVAVACRRSLGRERAITYKLRGTTQGQWKKKKKTRLSSSARAPAHAPEISLRPLLDRPLVSESLRRSLSGCREVCFFPERDFEGLFQRLRGAVCDYPRRMTLFSVVTAVELPCPGRSFQSTRPGNVERPRKRIQEETRRRTRSSRVASTSLSSSSCDLSVVRRTRGPRREMKTRLKRDKAHLTANLTRHTKQAIQSLQQ
jgi:pyruvate/2-oxoglutarate dehydrogenase complex dihydrolipoamide acyltransferase (E2) component